MQIIYSQNREYVINFKFVFGIRIHKTENNDWAIIVGIDKHLDILLGTYNNENKVKRIRSDLIKYFTENESGTFVMPEEYN